VLADDFELRGGDLAALPLPGRAGEPLAHVLGCFQRAATKLAPGYCWVFIGIGVGNVLVQMLSGYQFEAGITMWLYDCN